MTLLLQTELSHHNVAGDACSVTSHIHRPALAVERVEALAAKPLTIELDPDRATIILPLAAFRNLSPRQCV